MKRLAKGLVFGLLAISVTVIGLKAQEATPPRLTLTLKVPKSEIKLGENIDITIKLTNTSQEPITLLFGNHGNVASFYQYDVRNENGDSVAEVGPRFQQLPNGQMLQLPTRLPGSFTQGAIDPGKSVTSNSTVSDLYRFDHPGKYTIRVSRYASDTAGETKKVYSNALEITVIPAENANKQQ